MRRTSAAGMNAIKFREALGGNPDLAPYLDVVGIATIGYGATRDMQRNRVTMDHPPITEAAADWLLRRDLTIAERAVNAQVTYQPLPQGAFDALVSFVYNIGVGAFHPSKNTALRRLNAGDVMGAAEAMRWWVKGTKTINGERRKVRINGLVNRRAGEVAQFLQAFAAMQGEAQKPPQISADQAPMPPVEAEQNIVSLWERYRPQSVIQPLDEDSEASIRRASVAFCLNACRGYRLRKMIDGSGYIARFTLHDGAVVMSAIAPNPAGAVLDALNQISAADNPDCAPTTEHT